VTDALISTSGRIALGGGQVHVPTDAAAGPVHGAAGDAVAAPVAIWIDGLHPGSHVSGLVAPILTSDPRYWAGFEILGDGTVDIHWSIVTNVVVGNGQPTFSYFLRINGVIVRQRDFWRACSGLCGFVHGFDEDAGSFLVGPGDLVTMDYQISNHSYAFLSVPAGGSQGTGLNITGDLTLGTPAVPIRGDGAVAAGL
jgi:hypothetical protein